MIYRIERHYPLNGLLLAIHYYHGRRVNAPAEGGPQPLCLPLAAVVLGYKLRKIKFLLRLFMAAFLVQEVGTTSTSPIGSLFWRRCLTYDFRDFTSACWEGKSVPRSIDFFKRVSSSGWGMIYFFGAIYKIVGRNMLAFNTTQRCRDCPLAYMIGPKSFRIRRWPTAAILTVFFRHLVLSGG
jgi:hypothetical protein